MNNPKFRIFGAPYVFDLYQGNKNESAYFMDNFDKPYKEKRKLTIHRMASGMVSYSYLRYKMNTKGGRPNSFFGMSVFFDNEYCKNVENIFALFDAIYNDIVLKNGILLTALQGNEEVQAKYNVQTFAEAGGEVKNIENNILNNIRNHFANDILPLDSSFIENKSMVKLNDKMGNIAFVNALKKHSWVNISSEYEGEEEFDFYELVLELENNIEKFQSQIDFLKVGATQQQINTVLTNIDSSITKIQTALINKYKTTSGNNLNIYLQKHIELLEFYQKLDSLRKEFKSITIIGDTPLVPKLPHDPTTTPWWKPDSNPKPKLPFWKDLKVVAGLSVVAFIVISVIIFIPDWKGKADIDPIRYIEDSTEFQTQNKVIEQQDAEKTLVDELFNKALEEEDLAKKKNLLEQAQQYPYAYEVNPNIENDISEIQNQINEQLAAASRKAEQDKRARETQAETAAKKSENKGKPTYADVAIKLSPKKAMYSVGDQFTATASNCTGANFEWKFEDSLYANKKENPTTVEIKSVPESGKAILSLYIDGKQIKTVTIKISH